VLLGVLVLALGGIAALLGSLGDGGETTPTTPAPAQIEPLRDGATAEEDARLLAEWLRANSR
jgi:hypothetical protein